ncbi:MAG TPA: hypothetical protein H9912_13300, partial [Candidatus Eisenbergiella stercorigallinarum]|nr:hypothetical protein [Candidatus Eisenbergiella stercorigallinarum]
NFCEKSQGDPRELRKIMEQKERGRRIEAVLIFKCVFVQRRNLWNLIGVWGYDTKTNSEI